MKQGFLWPRWWGDEILEEMEAIKHLLDTMAERGNISPQKIDQHEEKDVERRTTLHRFAHKKQQLNYTSKSIQKSHPAMSQHYCRGNCKCCKKKEAMAWVAPILMKTKSSKHAMECQIDSRASCNITSHSLICKLLQDGISSFKKVNWNCKYMMDQSWYYVG